ncbi:MAG: acyl-CoA thioesterase [Solirubrobacterales bacterium]|nr:acyl-CoA thioesterase [Solirubrobacterales bacterium]
MSVPETRLTVPLRWRDMDMLGHLNQAVYHELLEEARGALLTSLTTELHQGYVLARVELDYRHEVRKDHGTVEIVVRVARVGGKSLTLEHDMLLPDGTLAATGITVLVGWDAHARTARQISAAERAVLGG